MKSYKIIRSLLLTALMVFCFTISNVVFAAPPPPPSGGIMGSDNNNNTSGGAPIGSGLFILLGLGAAYGSRKLWLSRQSDEVDLLK